MGGILSAEVALLGLFPSQGKENSIGHRILGTVNLDTPFLGMHPGVVASGIGSIFRPATVTPGAAMEPTNSEAPVRKPMSMPKNDDLTLDSLPEDSLRTRTEQPTSPFLSPTNDPNYNPLFRMMRE